MAITHWYVDPVSGDDTTGDGTADGTAWQTTQKALTYISTNGQGTDGDQINVKAGGTDTLTAALSYGSIAPSATQPCIIRGYRAVANDGGRGRISGGGTYAIISSSQLDSIAIIDMVIGDCGAAGYVVYVDNSCLFRNVEFWGGTGTGCLRFDSTNKVIDCQFHDFDGNGIYGAVSNNWIINCDFWNDGSNDMTNCIYSIVNSLTVTDCTFRLSGGTRGIYFGAAHLIACNNTFFAEAGSGTGIYITSGDHGHVIANNYFEGFSSSGEGIAASASEVVCCVLGANAFFNNATHYDSTNMSAWDQLDGSTPGETLGNTGLAKVGGNTHVNRFNFLRPVDTGEMLKGGYPKGGA